MWNLIFAWSYSFSLNLYFYSCTQTKRIRHETTSWSWRSLLHDHTLPITSDGLRRVAVFFNLAYSVERAMSASDNAGSLVCEQIKSVGECCSAVVQHVLSGVRDNHPAVHCGYIWFFGVIFYKWDGNSQGYCFAYTFLELFFLSSRILSLHTSMVSCRCYKWMQQLNKYNHLWKGHLGILMRGLEEECIRGGREGGIR